MDDSDRRPVFFRSVLSLGDKVALSRIRSYQIIGISKVGNWWSGALWSAATTSKYPCTVRESVDGNSFHPLVPCLSVAGR